MRNTIARWKLVTAGGTLWLLSGCDPQIQTTVENGLINVSTALLTALVRGFIQGSSEATQTALLMRDTLGALA